MLDDYPDAGTMLINGGGTIGYAERLGRLLDQPLNANPLRDAVSPGYIPCPLSVPTTDFERMVYANGSVGISDAVLQYALMNEDGTYGKPKPIPGAVGISCDMPEGDDTPYLTAPVGYHFGIPLKLNWNKTWEDILRERERPPKPRFGIRYYRELTYMCYPRTVREAKARRKGNRGNRKREYSVARMDVTIPNATITHTSDGTYEVSWDVHDG